MRETVSLNREWVVFVDPAPEEEAFTGLDALERSGLASVSVSVPCVVETVLSGLGLLEPDLFAGANILRARAFEGYRYYFTRRFELATREAIQERAWDIVFEGVDTLAVYQLNGVEIGRSANMLVPARFALDDAVRPGVNEVVVRIDPPVRLPPETLELGPGSPEPHREESLAVRKAPHMYGWDIMPRLVSGGIWRPVRLEQRGGPLIEDWTVATVYLASDHSSARLRLATLVSGIAGILGGELADARGGLSLELIAGCGTSEITMRAPVRGVRQEQDFWVERPALWWPRGYGMPACYRGTLRLWADDAVVDETAVSFGVRTVALDRASPGGDAGQRFTMMLNGEGVFCVGPNWVPLDADHSRDSSHYGDRVSLLADSGANMVRCWGGNVYEDEAFFDAMDALGIMVWQDLAMACAQYPQDDAFADALEAELRGLVPRLRRHPSVVIWCGDNEVDLINAGRGIDPDSNRLTREVIPRMLARLDPFRPYVPSSPYILGEAFRRGELDTHGDVHLWGPRGAFWEDFYTTYRAPFVSEIGFMGLPHVVSLREMFGGGESKWWPPGGQEWLVHATDPTVDPTSHYWERARKTFDRAEEYIKLKGSAHEADPADVVFASQITQAEGFKFAIEHARHAESPTKSGLLWWNLVDGWPQISDAVVDYYGRKKLAYYFIKRVQTPVLVSLLEDRPGRLVLKAVNHSRGRGQGRTALYRLDDSRSREILWEGSFDLGPGAHTTLARLAPEHNPTAAFLIDTETAGNCYTNHAVMGEPPFEPGDWRRWLTEILAPAEYEELASYGFCLTGPVAAKTESS